MGDNDGSAWTLTFRSAVGGMIGISQVVYLAILSSHNVGGFSAFLIFSLGLSALIWGMVLSGGIGKIGLKGWALALLTYLCCTAFAILSLLIVSDIFGYESEDFPTESFIEAILFSALITAGAIFGALIGHDGYFIWPVSFVIIQLIATRLRPKQNNNPNTGDLTE